MKRSRYPSLYQVNTRVWLTERSHLLGRQATLDDIPDAAFDRWAAQGFDWIWLLSVWQTGARGQQISRANPDWQREFAETLPDLRSEDVVGSGFAITAYRVHEDLGGDEALARVRERLQQRGLKLMLDFVPNHTAIDHPWVESHPEYYIQGTELDLAAAVQNYIRVERPQGDLILAHGRDPYFSGWPDTLQLNYANPQLQLAMIAELEKIADRCDGVRCDMAMLMLPEIFEQTWGVSSESFWPRAIPEVREEHPDFCFLAEVYWGKEWALQQQGFDFTYDKRLYDRLRVAEPEPIREHLHAGLDYQDKLARFLENHNEPRAAATFPEPQHQAAAVLTFFSPGLRFFHQGQFEGCTKRVSPHLVRAPQEPVNQELKQFYDRLLTVLRHPVFRNGDWQLVDCVPAWEGNRTHDCFIVYAWQRSNDERLLVAVNYAAHQSQCYVRLPFENLGGAQWRLQNLLAPEHYDRDGNDLQSRGLYLDMQPWQAAIYSFAQC